MLSPPCWTKTGVVAICVRNAGMTMLRNGPATAPASYKGLWPLLLAVEGRDDEASEALVNLVDSGATVNRLNLGYSDYANATILTGRRSPDEAANFVASGDRHLLHGPFWHQLGRRLVAEAATSDGWGDAERWWSEAGRILVSTDTKQSRRALHRDGRNSGSTCPRSWRFASLGVTRRGAHVLELVREGLANKEIAGRLVVSP